MHLRRVLDSHHVIANPSHLRQRTNRFARVLKQRLPKRRIAPGLSDHLRADVRADFSFVQLDDAIERGGFDIPLLDQNRLDRTHAQLHLGKMGAFIMVMVMCSHWRDTTNYRLSGQISERSTLKQLELLEQLEPLEQSSIKCIPSDGGPQSTGLSDNPRRFYGV